MCADLLAYFGWITNGNWISCQYCTTKRSFMVCAWFCINWPSMCSTKKMQSVPFQKRGRLTPPCTKIGHTSIEVYFLFLSNAMKEIEIRCKMDKIDMLSVTWFWFVVSAVEQSLLPCSTLISSLNMHTCMKSCQHVHDPPRSSVVTGKVTAKLISKVMFSFKWKHLNWDPCYDKKCCWNTCPFWCSSTTAPSFEHNGYLIWFWHANPSRMSLLIPLMTNRKDMKWYHELIHACDRSCMSFDSFCIDKTFSMFLILSYLNNFVQISLFAWYKLLWAHIFLWLGQHMFWWYYPITNLSISPIFPFPMRLLSMKSF